MKKIILAILLINTFSLCCFAAPRSNATTDELITYIKEKAVRIQLKKMRHAWNQLCKNDSQTCKEKQEWYDNLYYETATRKRDLQIINASIINGSRMNNQKPLH